jgi:hypothetical protein
MYKRLKEFCNWLKTYNCKTPSGDPMVDEMKASGRCLRFAMVWEEDAA